MSDTYINPKNVISPKNKIKKIIKVIYDGGEWGSSVCELEWQNDGEPKYETEIGMRWNGSLEHGNIGNPSSRGYPTWFIIPKDFRELVKEKAEELAEAL